MRLKKARIQGYRSIKDTGYFEIENMKTILVGINESGKTAILQALQKLNPSDGTLPFESLRDYPRSEYDEDIVHERIKASEFTFVEGHFSLSENEKSQMPQGFHDIDYIFGRYLNNESWDRIDGGLQYPLFSQLDKELTRLSLHCDEIYKRSIPLIEAETQQTVLLPSDSLKKITKSYSSSTQITLNEATSLISWLDENYKFVNEENVKEEERFSKIKTTLEIAESHVQALALCKSFRPTFVLFNNYTKIKPALHLRKLAERTENNTLDDTQYDYGNNCLLKYLGFTARELSNLGETTSINVNSADGLKQYKDQKDERNYRLNAASIRLTKAIVLVWNPTKDVRDVCKLKIIADEQYLKVVVEDELGVDVELDQRSEGFQWLVSFFIVFFAESDDKHKNAILLLDEPGLSLHALKQVEFRQTITRLSEMNQTIFTTHSPFLIGPNELDIVRVVEMTSRTVGTKVNTSVTAKDSGALLPLQEALGYDLAQSLFFSKKNLVLEGLTDYWYVEAFSELYKEKYGSGIDEKIVLSPANCAAKVVYYATILHAQNLSVSALLDSDSEGELAAKQDTLVSSLGNKRIIRTKDVYNGKVASPEIEDLVRETLITVGKNELKWDICEIACRQVTRPIVDLFTQCYPTDFSKFKLAKAFLKWARTNRYDELTSEEQEHISKLVERINKSFK